MERIELRTQRRKIRGKQVKRLRAEGWIPAIVYGPDMLPMPIQAQERVLSKALYQAGSTTLVNLFVDDEPQPHVVLAREIQRDPVTSRLYHVDFYNLRLTERVRTMPRLEFVGESPLVKSGEAVIIHSMNQVEVECLPTDLVNSISVDVSGLETLEDNVLVGDLPVPPGVTILADLDEVVVSVVPARVIIEEEEEVPAEEDGVVEAEVEEVED